LANQLVIFAHKVRHSLFELFSFDSQLGPFVIGFVLAPLGEEKLRSGLMMTAGDFSPIVTRPFPLAFTLMAVALLIWPVISDRRRKAKSRLQAKDRE